MASKNVLEFSSLKLLLRVTTFFLVAETIFILENGFIYDVQIIQSFSSSVDGAGVETLDLIEIRLNVWVAFLLSVSAATYFVLSTTGFGWYIKNIRHRINYMRWLHHAISTSLMIAIVALLSGINSLLSLMMIILVSVAVTMSGLLMEMANERRRNVIWGAYKLAVSLIASGWLVMMITFLSIYWSTNRSLPAELLALYIIVTVLVATFSITMWFHYKRIGPWKDYLYSEKMYIVVNFLAKTAFAAVMYVGYFR